MKAAPALPGAREKINTYASFGLTPYLLSLLLRRENSFPANAPLNRASIQFGPSPLLLFAQRQKKKREANALLIFRTYRGTSQRCCGGTLFSSVWKTAGCFDTRARACLANSYFRWNSIDRVKSRVSLVRTPSSPRDSFARQRSFLLGASAKCPFPISMKLAILAHRKKSAQHMDNRKFLLREQKFVIIHILVTFCCRSKLFFTVCR